MSVSDGKQKLTYDYHADGQIASANYGNGKTEDFLWDGLALIRRGGEQFINEPHVGGGNPVVSSKGTSYFNDMLGTTIGAKKNGKYSAVALTAFGERLDNVDSTSPAIRSLGEGWFTGKPYVEGLGRTFLMRNYRAGLAKWQTSDPMGYPDGWNQLAYCGNGVVGRVDVAGGKWTELNFVAYYLRFAGINAIGNYLISDLIDFAFRTDEIDTDLTGYTDDIWVIVHNVVMLRVWKQIDELVVSSIKASLLSEGSDSGCYDTLNSYSFVQAFWVFGGAKVSTFSTYTYNWETVQEGELSYISYFWESVSSAKFKDDFHDPASFGESFGRIFENDLLVGERYLITHQWEGIKHKWQGIIE
jgi:RHS repeat-associated protein